MWVKFNVSDGSFIAVESSLPRKSRWGSAWLDPGTQIRNCPKDLVGFGWARVRNVYPILREWEVGVPGDVSKGSVKNGVWEVTGTKKNKPKEEVTDTKKEFISTDLRTKFDAGFTYNGVVYDIDLQSQANMTATYALLAAGIPNAHGGYWRAKDNSQVTMTDDEAKAFFVAAYNYGSGLIRKSHEHKNAIRALLDNGVKTAKQIHEHDTSAGW